MNKPETSSIVETKVVFDFRNSCTTVPNNQPEINVAITELAGITNKPLTVLWIAAANTDATRDINRMGLSRPVMFIWEGRIVR